MEPTSFTVISLGEDCRSSDAARDIGIRQFALPFDWVVSRTPAIIECFDDDFERFHKNLHFNFRNTRVVDEYGIEFPHDYPFKSDPTNRADIIAEDLHSQIVDNLEDYKPAVIEKYGTWSDPIVWKDMLRRLLLQNPHLVKTDADRKFLEV